MNKLSKEQREAVRELCKLYNTNGARQETYLDGKDLPEIEALEEKLGLNDDKN